MRVVYLGREFETGQGLGEMVLERTDHHEHERLGVASQRELKEISKLYQSILLAIHSSMTPTRYKKKHTLLFR